MTASIAIVIESLGAGGAQHVATTLANAWVDKGVAVTLITFQGPERDFFRLDRRIKRAVTGGSGDSAGVSQATIANIRRILTLRKALRQSGVSTVLSFIGTTNILTVLAAAGLHKRVVIAERNDPERQSLGRAWDRLRRLLYRHADLVVVNSRGAIAGMQAYVPSKRLLWLPNPLRVPVAGRDDGPSPSASGFFLAVGRLQAQKAYDVLLSAFAQVVKVMPEQRIVIMGEGPLRPSLEQQAAELNLASQVQFIGQVADPFRWYRAAAVLVHPARFEGTPNVVLEAMSQGLPVIVSDAQTGLTDVVLDGESGLVVPVDRADKLAEAMLSLARDSQRRQQLGRAARAAVADYEPGRAIAAWSAAILR